MGSSYREASEKYKNDKKKLIDGYNDIPYKKTKKNKKKNKRSNHKHEYIPAVYHFYNIDFKGKEYLQTGFGFHCYICGRIKDFYYNWWSANSNQLKNFKLEYPYYTEITLPKDWDIHKNIPV